MWAVCRHDHGLTWSEFQALTLEQFEALEERRNVAIRHARFNAALVTTTMFNAHRSADADPLEVWDFIPGYERDQDVIERDKVTRSIRHGVLVAFTNMRGKTVEQVRGIAPTMIRSLTANGTDAEDADAIVRDAFEEVIQVPWSDDGRSSNT